MKFSRRLGGVRRGRAPFLNVATAHPSREQDRDRPENAFAVLKCKAATLSKGGDAGRVDRWPLWASPRCASGWSWLRPDGEKPPRRTAGAGRGACEGRQNAAVIGGDAPSYYLKQFALQGVLDVFGSAPAMRIELNVEVVGRPPKSPGQSVS